MTEYMLYMQKIPGLIPDIFNEQRAEDIQLVFVFLMDYRIYWGILQIKVSESGSAIQMTCWLQTSFIRKFQRQRVW